MFKELMLRYVDAEASVELLEEETECKALQKIIKRQVDVRRRLFRRDLAVPYNPSAKLTDIITVKVSENIFQIMQVCESIPLSSQNQST